MKLEPKYSRFSITAHWQRILQIACFLGFLFLLSRLIEMSLLGQILGQIRFEILVLAILVYAGNIAIRAYRWKRIFSLRTRTISLKDAYLITLVGMALNMVIPATLGDIARSYYGYKIYGFKEEMFSTVLADKMFAFCSLFILGGISGTIMGYYVLATVSWLAAIAAFLPVAWPRLVPWGWLNMGLRYVKKSLDAERLIQAFTLPVFLKIEIMLISIGGWLCTCIYFYVICRAFPGRVNLWYVVAIMPMLTIARLFPFTLNALGPMEVAVTYFFGQIGIPSTLAVVISLTSNLISSVIPGSLGLLVILTAKQKQYPGS